MRILFLFLLKSYLSLASLLFSRGVLCRSPVSWQHERLATCCRPCPNPCPVPCQCGKHVGHVTWGVGARVALAVPIPSQVNDFQRKSKQKAVGLGSWTRQSAVTAVCWFRNWLSLTSSSQFALPHVFAKEVICRQAQRRLLCAWHKEARRLAEAARTAQLQKAWPGFNLLEQLLFLRTFLLVPILGKT